MYFIGCDVSKLTLDLAGCHPAKAHKILSHKAPNTQPGWRSVGSWIDQHWPGDRSEVCLVMEATGVYHQLAAHDFYAAGFKVIICNPGRAADYSRSQNRLNKNDALDAQSLQQYGARLERIHWFEPNLPEIEQLKSLLSLLRQLEEDIRRWNNRQEKASFEPAGATVSHVLRRQLRNLTRERDRTQEAIDELIQCSEGLSRDQQLMCSIVGIGPKTSQVLLPFVHGARFESARQLAAYIGLAPCHRRSGTSLNSPGRLSGRGNAQLRAAMYMPALTAARRNPELKQFYDTLISRGKAPKQAITAVMRKLVHLCYGVVKNQASYRENYGCLL